jgi:hypothetical protein
MRLVAEETATNVSASCSHSSLLAVFTVLSYLNVSSSPPAVPFHAGRLLSGNTEYAIAVIHHVFVCCNTRLAIRKLVCRSTFPRLFVEIILHAFRLLRTTSNSLTTKTFSYDASPLHRIQPVLSVYDTDFSTTNKICWRIKETKA